MSRGVSPSQFTIPRALTCSAIRGSGIFWSAPTASIAPRATTIQINCYRPLVGAMAQFMSQHNLNSRYARAFGTKPDARIIDEVRELYKLTLPYGHHLTPRIPRQILGEILPHMLKLWNTVLPNHSWRTTNLHKLWRDYKQVDLTLSQLLVEDVDNGQYCWSEEE